jgi:hypothetical protein
MNRWPKIAALTLLVGVLFLLSARLVRDVYVESIDRTRIEELESKVKGLQDIAHPAWRVRWSGFSVSTTDRPQNSHDLYDLRLPYGTNTVQKLDGELGKVSGHIVAAWISDWTPRSEMTKFDQLSVSNRGGTKFEIVAKAHTNESVTIEGEVTFIIEE